MIARQAHVISLAMYYLIRKGGEGCCYLGINNLLTCKNPENKFVPWLGRSGQISSAVPATYHNPARPKAI